MATGGYSPEGKWKSRRRKISSAWRRGCGCGRRKEVGEKIATSEAAQDRRRAVILENEMRADDQ